VLRPSPDDYGSAVPGPEAVLLLIEVADSSLGWDRDYKLPRYAEAGIPEVWIVDVAHARITVHRDPSEGSYRTQVQLEGSDSISPLAFSDLSLRCADLLA
ncbi:MAG: Uma2 family endonuclease, partial [Chloroflexi bacterium]|nr:Uma2 family endonuclease [Chloroflexota bacterium]